MGSAATADKESMICTYLSHVTTEHGAVQKSNMSDIDDMNSSIDNLIVTL